MRIFVLLAGILTLLIGGAGAGYTAATAPPPTPTGPTAIALDGRVELAWQAVGGATGYAVYRGTSPTTITTQLTPAGGVTATSYTDTTATNGTTYYYVVRAVQAGTESPSSLTVQTRPSARACSTGNAVVVENCFTGDTTWRANNVTTVGGGGIEGFATAASINKGGSVDLKVNSDAGSTFRIEIYRSGYYGGTGARLFSTVRGVSGVPQPACQQDNNVGLVDCSNWSASATITTTASWPSGVYLLKLIRQDTSREYHILLVVRDDARNSDVLYGVGFTDYQAYNSYGGRSLYDFNSNGTNTVAGTPRAVKVSFDRPFTQPRDNQPNWYTKIEYQAVYWLEQSGYDVAYISDTDLERSGAQVQNHKAYVLPSHDEYYSAGMRNALLQGRDAGTGIMSLGGNQIYWKIRFENSPFSGGQDRIQVCYKSTQSGPADPSGIPTGTWRDPAGANNPENALLGAMYVGDNDGGYFPLVVGATEGADRVFRYTGLDAQAPGTSTSIGSTLIGWEWDRRVANGREPAGVKTLTTSPVTGNLLQDAGRVYAPGQTTVNAVKYVASSGALVFNAGTNHWDRGLANNADGIGEEDVKIRQVTTNVLADMNVVPQTPAGDIVLDNPSGTRPPAPTGLTATPLGTDSVRLTWNAVAGVQGYNVYRTLAPRSGGEPLGARANPTLVTGTTYTDSGLSSGTAYYFVVTSVSAGSQSLASNEAGATTAASAGQATRINVAGPQYTSSTGQVFAADNFFVGGSTFSASTGTAISGTNDPTLYRTERWGNFRYQIPVSAGTYDVRLHFAELYYGTVAAGGVGKRVFSVDATDKSGGTEITNLDIYAEVGPRAALIKTIPSITVSDGVLNLDFLYGPADDPEVTAIEVLPRSTPPQVTATTPQNGDGGVSTSATVDATFSRAMDASTLTTTSFTLKRPDGTVVPSAVSYVSGTSTARLTPTQPLAFGTTYTARIESTVKAADGELLAAPATWTFTTVNAIAPTVTATFPTDGATAISASAKPRATFSRSLDPATVTPSSFTLRNGATTVPATVSYDAATRSAVLTPTAPLAFETTYTGTVNTTIKASDGVPLAAPVSWSFTTAAAPPPAPTVTGRSPAPGAVDVARTTVVDATFSRDMDASTIDGSSFTLTGGSAVSASVSYDAATRRARLTPASPLAFGTTYTARVTTAAHASDGTPVDADVTWTFTTVAPPPAPTVISTTPADGASLVSRDSNVTATFSQDIDPTTLTSSSFTLRDSGGATVPAVVSYNAATRVATLDPTGLLAGGVGYTARIETTVTGAGGAPLNAPVTWSFATAACPCSLFSDALQPANEQLATQDGRVGPGPWSYELGVKLTVTQPMRLNGLRFYKSAGETGTHVGRIWTDTGVSLGSVTFTGESASGWQQQALTTPLQLQPGSTYVVSVNANAFFVTTLSALATQIVSGPLRTVADGLNGVYGDSAGVFPTQSYSSSNYFVDVDTSIDGSPAAFTVSSTNPAAGATGVARTSTVTATFSRAADASTVSASTFTLTTSGGAAVPATVAYDDATNSAALTPSSPLTYSATYTARVTTGVRAVDGTSLASSTSWTFTVAAAVPLQVTQTSPAAGASDVGSAVRPTATFSKDIKPATLTASTFTLTGAAGAVTATVSYDSATRTATLTPAAALADGTYTARLDPSITATDDATLATPFTWSFTVRSGLTAPTVTSRSPLAGAASVPRSTTVTATFSRSMDPTSITTTSFTLTNPSGQTVASTISYDSASRTATLTPSATLAGGIVYTARLSTAVRAADTTPLANAESWSFTTAACPCSLFSATLQPVNQNQATRDGRPGSGPFSYELGVKITVDQPMRLNAIRFFKGSKETGTHTGRIWTSTGGSLGTVGFVSETASGWQQQSLSSPLLLQPGTVYVVSVNANAFFNFTANALATQIVSGPLRSVAGGNGVFGASAGTFPTQSFNSSNYFVDLVVAPDGDPTPPAVTSTSPAAGATGVLRNATVSATFSRSMDPTTITTSTFTLTGPSGAVPATVAYNDANLTATLTPSSPLAYSSSYTARVTTGARATDGSALPSQVSWSFTTAAPVPPTVTSTVPAPAANDIGSGVKPRATFSKSMNGSTITASTFTLTGPAGAVSASVAYDDATLSATLTPAAPLADGAYTARIDGSVTSADAVQLGTAFTWSFTVTSPPTLAVTSTTPANGATGVSKETPSVSATFNRSLDPASVTTSTFRLRAADNSLVAATVSYDGATRTVRLTPAAALAGGATFTAELTTGIRASDGTPLASTVTWSFTTAACPCSLFPSVLQPTSTGLDTRDGRSGNGPFSYELGVKVQVTQAMSLSAVRFYKDAQETGTHVATIWTASGTPLATVTFTNETASGWQEQALGTPLALSANTTYVISVNANAFFVSTTSGLATQVVSGPLRSVADGQNGVFGSAAATFPTQSWSSSNYFIDVVVR